MIDLYNAELDLVKIGAPVSFIKKGKKVDVLKASTLPVGIVEDIQVESIQRKLEAGDFIIMMSDGLMDTVNSDINQEEWLKDVISKLDTKNPQEMADTILRTVKTASNNHIRDDMTVLVAKVWERS
jgi:stage II sporulation protein E